MKKYTAFILMFILGVSIFVIPVGAEESDLLLTEDAKSSILLERDTGQVIYEKNAHEKLPPASMTKLMTLLLIMEALEKGEITLEEKVTVSERAASMGGSQVFLAHGEQMTVDDLLKAIAIASGNDASVAMAERIAGTEEAFAILMNEKTAELKLENTQFKNSSGLPSKDHYSSAYDMAMISKELLKYENITNYTSVYEDYLRKDEENEFWLVNTNKLIRFHPHVDGLKTGFTNEAKFCLTATAKQDDMRVVAVVMGAETVKLRNEMVMNLIDYGFNHYETEKLFSKGEKIAEIRNLQSEKIVYDVTTSEPLSVLHKKGKRGATEINTDITLNEQLTLPMTQGSQVGELSITANDQLIENSALLIEEEIKQATLFQLWKRSLQNIVKFDAL